MVSGDILIRGPVTVRVGVTDQRRVETHRHVVSGALEVLEEGFILVTRAAYIPVDISNLNSVEAGVVAISKNDGNIKVPAPQKEKLI